MNCVVCSGGLHAEDAVKKCIARATEVEESGGKLSGTLHASGRDDMSVMAMQRLNDQCVTCNLLSVCIIFDLLDQARRITRNIHIFSNSYFSYMYHFFFCKIHYICRCYSERLNVYKSQY